MKHYPATFLKYISILQRNTSRYFDMVLEPFGIGSGQQFFCAKFTRMRVFPCMIWRK